MSKGFTLVELMVVIAIMAILMGLTVPIAKSMLVGNQVMTCATNLSKIAQAMKLYYMDYQAVPPVWIAENGTDPATPYDEMTDPLTQPVDPGTGEPTNPLMALYKQGYLRDKSALHCPGDREHRDGSSPTYYYSYVWRQPDTIPAAQAVKIVYQNYQDSTDSWNGTALYHNRFKYMPVRIVPHGWAVAPTVYTQQRQLARDMRAVTVGGKVYWAPVVDSTWMPSDGTIITWCDYHADGYTKNGVGQYQVLFWDGSVAMKSRALFEKGSGTPLPPPAGWEVGPGDQ
jgi:prepilin-type N-terminal cleavage/methylation domain-containing protein